MGVNTPFQAHELAGDIDYSDTGSPIKEALMCRVLRNAGRTDGVDSAGHREIGEGRRRRAGGLSGVDGVVQGGPRQQL